MGNLTINLCITNMTDMSKQELDAMKSAFYAMCQMPDEQQAALKALTKGFDKLMTAEQKQIGRDKSRATINSIIDDGFAEQDRLSALDTENNK